MNCTVPVAEEGDTVAIMLSLTFLVGETVVGVRVSVVFDFDGVIGVLPPLLLHPIATEATAKRINSDSAPQCGLRRGITNKSRQASDAPPAAANHPRERLDAIGPPGTNDAFMVVIVRELLPLPLMLFDGAKMQTEPLGRPEQASVTVPVKPFMPATVSVSAVVVEPFTTVSVVGLGVMLKSGVVMVTAKLVVAVLPAESVTLTPKFAVPAVGEEPDTTPPLDKLKPNAVRLLPPDVTVQL